MIAQEPADVGLWLGLRSVGLKRKEAEELEGGKDVSNVGQVEDKVGEVKNQGEDLKRLGALRDQVRVLKASASAKRRRLQAVESNMMGWVRTGCKLSAVNESHKGVWFGGDKDQM